MKNLVLNGLHLDYHSNSTSGILLDETDDGNHYDDDDDDCDTSSSNSSSCDSFTIASLVLNDLLYKW